MGMSLVVEFVMNKVLKLEFPPIFVNFVCNHRVGGTRICGWNILVGCLFVDYDDWG
jgi:hypothetical protein